MRFLLIAVCTLGLASCASGPGKLKVDSPLTPYESGLEEEGEDSGEADEVEGSEDLPTRQPAATPAPKTESPTAKPQ